MKVFNNKTTLGNEEAVRRGKVVPNGAVNLAWAKSPPLTPDKNVVIVDTSRVVSEDTINTASCGIYYANELGILEDINANQLFQDEFPAVTDTFSLQGDLTGVDLQQEHILAYVHISRYFHIDFSGLTLGSGLSDFDTPNVKVVNSKGQAYVDDAGVARFKIRICPAFNIVGNAAIGDQYPYRVWAFVDTDTNEDLYLTYDKIEVAKDGSLKNQVLYYKELLNPQPTFQYRPEEAEVVDPINREKLWYSTKPVILKDQAVGLPVADVNGYKVFVPKKALIDPRLFQLFRWRVSCEFTQNFNVDTRTANPLNVGVIVTNNDLTPPVTEVFNRLSDSLINTDEITFANPLSTVQNDLVKKQPAYWYVNLDSITFDQLAQFDLLIWSPTSPSFDFSNYLAQIKYFTRTLGRVMLIETENHMVPMNLGITTTGGVTPSTGLQSTAGIPAVASAGPHTQVAMPLQSLMDTIYRQVHSPSRGGVGPQSGQVNLLTVQQSTFADGTPTGWASLANATLGVSNIRALTGTYSLAIQAIAGIETDVITPIGTSGIRCVPGVNYAYEASFRAATAARQIGLLVRFFDSFGVVVTQIGTSGFDSTRTWTTLSSVATAPPTAAFMSVIAAIYAPSIGETHYLDSIILSNQFSTALPLPPPGTTVFTGTYYNRVGEATVATETLSSQSQTGTLVLPIPLLSQAPFSLFDATSVNGWKLQNRDAISTLQTSFGGVGSYTQFITDMPSDAVGLVYVTAEQDQTFTDVIINGGPSYNITTYKTKVANGQVSSAPVVWNPPATQGTLQVTAPLVPLGSTYDKVEIYQDTQWSGLALSASITTTLNGPGFLNGIVNSGAIMTGSTGDLAVFNSTVDVGGSGGTYNLYTGILTSGSPPTSFTQQTLRATTYYHTATTTTQVVTVSHDTFFKYQYTVPYFTLVPVVCQVGNLIFSTFNLLSSANADLVGAKEFLFNLCMYAASGKSLYTYSENSYASNFTFSSPWHMSWVINTTSNPVTLSPAEKSQYNFQYLPQDVATPTPVWQRQLSASTLRELLDSSMTPDMQAKIAGASRTYTIETTNDKVDTASVLTDDTIPYAWTWAYTPVFNVPSDFPAYIIREREVIGDFQAGQYTYRTYPDKPYSCQAKALYDNAFDLSTTAGTTWNATGTATETYDSSSWVPDQSISVPVTHVYYKTQKQEIELNGWNNSGQPAEISQHNPYKGSTQAQYIALWSEWNARNWNYGNGSLCWPYPGFGGYFSMASNPQPEFVKFVQDFFNRVPGQIYGNLRVDGIYGPNTHNVVYNFQVSLGAIYQDGCIDSETQSLLGGQILRYGFTWSPYTDGTSQQPWINRPLSHMSKNLISGHAGLGNGFLKNSNIHGTPPMTWDVFAVFFNQAYDIHSIKFTADAGSPTGTILFESAEVRSNFAPANLSNFNPETMAYNHLNRRVGTRQQVQFDFPTTTGNCILLGLAADTRVLFSNFYSELAFGVYDVSALATVTTQIPYTVITDEIQIIPAHTVTTKTNRQIFVSATGSANVTTDQPIYAQAIPNYTGGGTLSNIQWFSLAVSNPDVIGTITTAGLISLSNGVVTTQDSTGATAGPVFPNLPGPYYWMDSSLRRHPVPETGWISKADGLKILCDSNSAPIGFPPLPSLAATDTQRHYVNLSLGSSGTEATVQCGFYDIQRQEFVVNTQGHPEMPYIEYITRGPRNIYIAIISTYELDTQQALPVYQSAAANPSPSVDDHPLLPHLTAMPIYGVCPRGGSKITLEPLPSGLGPNDVWPIAVRRGDFNRQISIPSGVTTYIAPYQGTSVTAFYSLPEAKVSGWSALYGSPNADVQNEQPIIVDDNVIQVRQPPFLMQREPTTYPSPADPIRPIFQVSQRASVNDAWATMSFDQISDYNSSTGEIFLQNNVVSNDPLLFQVSYTTARGNYYFKQYNGVKINLNPYPGQSRSLVNQSIHVFIVPQYVLDNSNSVIAQSIATSCLGFTTDPSMFDPLNPSYDPLAVRLGIVYMSSTVNIQEIVLLDTRSRGGGAYDFTDPFQVRRLIEEATSYWDIDYGSGMSYQLGGFVVVRLPKELKALYTDDYVNTVIQRNITAGVQYKLEDLNGDDW